ncbi:ATP-binding cassette domain-containing protein [Picosynechococcus sp. PCC 7117]|uniref:ATP-binding cassette domain-containing protein n=1 Tax=Picosynechococcus sp. PCC 7117 TaxID=195498 RepID=UPI0008105C71|nr:ATP-binding cassette domain-containing protein [Picosynechococcus sp. PCC 7117]ANV87198.1 ABC transporter [Picosynechococcus sp. PCC 7117]
MIQIKNINHYYGKGHFKKQVLFNISLDIQPGEIVLMTGPSGSGKTTLLTLIGGLRSVQEGSLKVFKTELFKQRKKSLENIRKKIGFIFQSHNLLSSLTALQNVQIANILSDVSSVQESKNQAEKILKAVGLETHLDAYPSQLSGGQKQRVAIARALVNKPKLILADEPTASLDKLNREDVLRLLHQLAKEQNCTVLFVTHDTRVLGIADRIINLEDGKITNSLEC